MPKKSARAIPECDTKAIISDMRAIYRVATEFRGQFEELESAIGMMVVGRLVGWRVLVLIHNKRTIRNYERILGIDIREEFPEVGPLAEKSVAYVTTKKIGQFWKAVSGEIKIENRRSLVDN